MKQGSLPTALGMYGALSVSSAAWSRSGSPSGAWGVAPGFRDVGGRWVTPPPDTVPRALAGMGAAAPEPPASGPLIVRPGETPALPGPAEVVTEDGAVLPASAVLPDGLPLGYHTLRALADGSESRLIVSPGRCRPLGDPAWAWSAQLYGVRSRESWGLGDLADLRELGRWAAGM